MSSKLAILRNVRVAHLNMSPFPYLVIEDALPDAIDQELAAGFPSAGFIFVHHRSKQADELNRPNTRCDMPAAHVKKNPDLDLGLWRVFKV